MIRKIRAYITGNLRYSVYYTKFNWLIRKHIKEQIETRINSMDKMCYDDGSCKMCGCKTTALQMANKECDKPCYPEIVNKKDWIRFKKGRTITRSLTLIKWNYNSKLNKFEKYELG